MIADIIRALVGVRGAVRITHTTPDSHTVIEYTSSDALLAMAEVGRITPRRGNESPTAYTLLLATPEQAEERRRKLEAEARFQAECMRGVGCGGWS